MGGRDRIDRSNILDRETGNRSAAEGNRSCPGKVRPGDGYRCAATTGPVGGATLTTVGRAT